MTNNELYLLKKEIESLREEINTYIEYPEIFKEYFGKVVPYTDNKFAALNSCV